jgi:DNA-binding GntR family transcriptional regulator
MAAPRIVKDETVSGPPPPKPASEAETAGGDAERGSQLSLRATNGLRDLIASRALFPGEQIRQADLADRLGVSRSPLREALHALEQEGLLVHEPNRGFFVTRLDADELRQIYRMRELIEPDLIRTIRPASELVIESLRNENAAIAAALSEGSVSSMLTSNRAFHRIIFELSPLALLRRETLRLWALSEPYHAAYLCHPDTRKKMIAEHELIIDTLAENDLVMLGALLQTHREAAKEGVLLLLPPSGGS